MFSLSDTTPVAFQFYKLENLMIRVEDFFIFFFMTAEQQITLLSLDTLLLIPNSYATNIHSYLK